MATEVNKTNNVSLNCGYDDPYSPMQASLRVFGNMPLILFGSVLNLLSAIVFTRRRMRKSMVNWFLLALAISDQGVLMCNFFMMPLPILVEQTQSVDARQLGDRLTRWTYPIGHLAHCCSVYMLVTVACYRYAGLCHPFKARAWMTARTVKTAIGCTVLFNAVFTFPRWFELHMVPCIAVGFDNQTSAIVFPTSVRHNRNYFVVYKVILNTAIVFVIPFSILIATSVCIVIALHKSSAALQHQSGIAEQTPQPSHIEHSATASNQMENQALMASTNDVDHNSPPLTKRQQRLADRPVHCRKLSASSASLRTRRCAASPVISTRLLTVQTEPHVRSTTTLSNAPSARCVRGSSKSSKHGQKPPGSGITATLLAVVAVFMLCNTLPFINNTLEIVMGLGEKSQMQILSKATFTAFVEIGSILVTFNSSINFLIYLAFSSKFREQLIQSCGLADDNGRGRTTAAATTTCRQPPTTSTPRNSGRTQRGRSATIRLSSNGDMSVAHR